MKAICIGFQICKCVFRTIIIPMKVKVFQIICDRLISHTTGIINGKNH